MTRSLAIAALTALAACTAPAAEPVAPPAPPPPPPPVERILDGSFDFRGAIVQGGLAVGQAPAGAVSVTLDGKPTRLDPQGRFLVGFGRDAVPDALVEARLADGTRVRQALKVGPRDWRIERIPQLAQSSTPNPEYEKLRSAEVARIATARSATSDAIGWTQRFAWPATGRISGVYGSQRILGGVPRAPHAGVDIARPSGTPVASPADGIIVLASPPKFSLEGNLLIIDHGNRLFSSFLHLSRIDVKVGDVVRQGQPVGTIGMTGRATGPHLHWAMSWGDVRVDPQLLVPPMQP
ncbi:M23 family metallopeptidase [Sphingoaurantiacus capsulatus]|uniref:M23 family metallopeptidase n=1 Tax=Sphingoaurantiacus capsulatus TaxID=1771310 RepID=A0ABV7XAC9_9SPHN